MAFADWSPAQLAHALGYVLDLRQEGLANRNAYLVGPSGRSHPVSHSHAHSALSRLAVLRGVDPSNPPVNTPRALINGKPQ